MRIAITGSSGLIGGAVRARLLEEGHTVSRVVRSREAARAPDAVYWRPAQDEIDADGIAGHDAVVNLAGENIFGLWTRSKRERIYHSRVDGTRLLATTLAGLPAERRPAAMVNASAVGYYGTRPADRPQAEDAPPADTFMARVVRDWEAAADPAREAGIRTVHLRFAPVVDPHGLLLQGLATATRLGLGATLGSGAQAFPWVTRADVVGAISFALTHPSLEGPVNVAAPDRVTNREFTDTLARVLNRPRVLHIPAPALALLGDFGREVSGGAWVLPRKLEEAGYEWRDPALEPALRRLLGR